MTEEHNKKTKNNKVKNLHHSFLDMLRIAATCAVVLLHTVTGVMDTTDMSVYPLEKTVFLAALDLITWCVPVFVLISGYLFLNPDREITFRQMLLKYCRRIVLALFLFGVPYACLELIAGERTFRLDMLREGVVMVLKGQSWSHMWYLYMILILYLITPGLKAVLKKCPKGVLYSAMALLLAGSSILPFVKKLFALENLRVLPDGGIYLFYYLCGYLFAVSDRKRSESISSWKADERRRKDDRKCPEADMCRQEGDCRRKTGCGQKQSQAVSGKWVMPAAALAAVLLAGMVFSRLIGNYSVQMAYNYPFTVVLALLLFYLASQMEEKCRGQEKFLKNTGALCFTIYLVHPVFLNIFYKFLHVTPLDFPIGFSLPVFFAAVLALSVLTAWILRRIPGLARYVL